MLAFYLLKNYNIKYFILMCDGPKEKVFGHIFLRFGNSFNNIL